MHETEGLGERICELAAHLNAATCRLLELIATFDDEAGWGREGCRSCAHWLNWKCGIGLNAAREKVRVAQALKTLPQIHAAFARGTISYSKTRAMTRVATADNESYLLMIAEHGTAAHVETVVRGYRQARESVALEQANERHARREVIWRYEDDGSLVFTCRLDPEDGARLIEALEDRRHELTAQRGTADEAGDKAPNATVRADALMDLITHSADTEVVVHVSAETLCDDDDAGGCRIEHGPDLFPETARRLACDAGVVHLVENADGEPLNVGRRTRSIPPALKRALSARDRGCRFPGCDVTRHVQGHHIEHWAHGGETSIDNMLLVCWHHHRLLHEGGFSVERRHDGQLRFHRPDGTVIHEQPTPARLDDCPEHGLEQINAARGLIIDHTTGRCRWDGEPMDRAMAVEGLLATSGELEWEKALPR